jgi:hypothetical protein
VVIDIEKLVREAEWLIGVCKYDDAIAVLRSQESPNDVAPLHPAGQGLSQPRGHAGRCLFQPLLRHPRAGTGQHRPAAARHHCHRLLQEGTLRRTPSAHFRTYVTEQSGHATQHMLGLAYLYNQQPKEALPWLKRAWEKSRRNGKPMPMR